MESKSNFSVKFDANTENKDYSQLYQESFWPKHHFSNDDVITLHRFKEKNIDIFKQIYSDNELRSFADQVIQIARNYSSSHMSKQENDLFYSFAPLALYI